MLDFASSRNEDIRRHRDYFYVAVREGSYARIVGNMSELGWERDIFLSRSGGGATSMPLRSRR